MDKCAFDKSKEICAILTCKNCLACGFYKTKREVIEGRAKAMERLNSIPGGFILQAKYYGEHSTEISVV